MSDLVLERKYNLSDPEDNNSNWFKKFFDRIDVWFCRMCGKTPKSYKLTAHQAWVGTTYGEDECPISLDQRIANKQASIQEKIRACFHAMSISGQKYFTFVEIEENLATDADRILQPFIEGGFEVVNVSRLTNVLKDTNVYLISWRNAFKNRVNNEMATVSKAPVTTNQSETDKKQTSNK